MHYYKFNIADYRKDTTHLTPIEHYIYRTLIDNYYLDEKPIPKETQSVIRRLSLDYSFEHNLKNVLHDFFDECEEGFKHKRIDTELHDYVHQCETNKVNGHKGGRPTKPKETEPVIFANRKKPNRNPNQEPITTNQEPITKEKHTARKRAIPLPENFDISPSVKAWADKHGHTNLDVHLENFIDVSLAKGYTYVDWDAAFRKAITGDWAKCNEPKSKNPHTMTEAERNRWAF